MRGSSVRTKRSFLPVPFPFQSVRSEKIRRSSTIGQSTDSSTCAPPLRSPQTNIFILSAAATAAKGLGIAKIDEYARKFGLGAPTGIALIGEKSGVIPTPDWKAEVFGANDPWRIGDTYHTRDRAVWFSDHTHPGQFTIYCRDRKRGQTHTPQLLRVSRTPQYTLVGIPTTICRSCVRACACGHFQSHGCDSEVPQSPDIHIAARHGTRRSE